MVVETTNTIGWNALKERLRASKAVAVCSQEHHTLLEDAPEWSQQACRCKRNPIR